MRVVLLSLFLAACATSSPTAPYERGTFVRPPPAPARPGVGAPTYEPHAPGMKPQPQPRPLPVPHTAKTRSEPTIWAGATQEEAPLSVLDIPLPVPEPLLAEDEPHVRQCADVLRGAMAYELALDARATVPKGAMPCAISRAYVLCLGAYASLATNRGKVAESERLERLLGAGKEAESRACKGWASSGEVRRFIEAFVLAWRSM